MYGVKGRERRATGSVQAVRGTAEATASISVKYLPLRDIARPYKGEHRGGIPLCRGYGGVPQAFLGREGGKNSAYVAATTPTPPIAHNAPDDVLQRSADREARL